MGLATARCLAEDGARVALVGRSQTVLDEAVDELSRLGSRAHSDADVSSRVTRHAERFPDRAAIALSVLTEQGMLVHGDIRADNVFFAGDRCKIDLGYLVSQGLPTSIRSGHDEELVRTYLNRLVALGVRGYGFDDA